VPCITELRILNGCDLATHVNNRPIRIIKVKVASQLLSRRLSIEAAVGALLDREKPDWHTPWFSLMTDCRKTQNLATIIAPFRRPKHANRLRSCLDVRTNLGLQLQALAILMLLFCSVAPDTQPLREARL
jgi:hypothetical protein